MPMKSSQKKAHRRGCIYCGKPCVKTFWGRVGSLCQRHRKINNFRWKHKTPQDLFSIDSFVSLNSVSLSYAAGLIDGEGCLRVGNTGNAKRGLYCIVTIRMTEEEPLFKMATIFGGRVTRIHRADVKKKFVFSWEARGRRAGAVCLAILPYLQIARKKRFAEFISRASSIVGVSHHWEVMKNPELRKKIRNFRAEFHRIKEAA